MWTPHMPALEGETASVVATASQTLTVDSSTAVPTTFVGLQRGWSAELSRTADGKELDVTVLRPGLSVLVK